MWNELIFMVTTCMENLEMYFTECMYVCMYDACLAADQECQTWTPVYRDGLIWMESRSVGHFPLLPLAPLLFCSWCCVLALNFFTA